MIKWKEAEIEVIIPVKDGRGATIGFTTAKVMGLRGIFEPPVEIKNGETLETLIIIEGK